MASTCELTAFSGAYGAVFSNELRLARITKWRFSLQANGQSWNSSAIPIFSQYLVSTMSGDGNIDFKYDASFPQNKRLWVGDCVQLVLLMRPPVPSTDTVDGFFISSAVIDEAEIEVDVDSGEMVTGSVRFKNHGDILMPRRWNSASYFSLLPR